MFASAMFAFALHDLHGCFLSEIVGCGSHNLLFDTFLEDTFNLSNLDDFLFDSLSESVWEKIRVPRVREALLNRSENA